MSEVFGSTPEAAEHREYTEQELSAELKQAGLHLREKILAMNASDPGFEDMRQLLEKTGYRNSTEGAE